MVGDVTMFTVVLIGLGIWTVLLVADIVLAIRRARQAEAKAVVSTCECPRCSEVALWESSPRSWECSECGHYETR